MTIITLPSKSQLDASIKAQTSQLIADHQFTVVTANGRLNFGSNVVRGAATILDVSAYQTVSVLVSIAGSSENTTFDVVTFSAAGRVAENSNNLLDSAFLWNRGPASTLSNPDIKLDGIVSDAIDVSRAQGLILAFFNAPLDSVIRVRVLGGQSSIIETRKTTAETLYAADVAYSDLFTVSGATITPKTLALRFPKSKEYSRFLLYITSSYSAPVTVQMLEWAGITGLINYGLRSWDGASFGAVDKEIVTIPAVASESSSNRLTVKFPVHHASRLLQDGAFDLAIRLTPAGPVPQIHNGGSAHTLNVALIGIR